MLYSQRAEEPVEPPGSTLKESGGSMKMFPLAKDMTIWILKRIVNGN
jgi:hypothetical protein